MQNGKVSSFELTRVARAVLTKLGLSDELPRLSVSPIINVVMDLADLINDLKASRANYDVGTASKTIGTVPEGKRWHVILVRKAITVGNNSIYYTIGGITGPLNVDVTAAQLTYTTNLVLAAGDNLFLPAGNVADTAIECTYVYWEETVSVTKAQ